MLTKSTDTATRAPEKTIISRMISLMETQLQWSSFINNYSCIEAMEATLQTVIHAQGYECQTEKVWQTFNLSSFSKRK